jgi:hypothetical protein
MSQGGAVTFRDIRVKTNRHPALILSHMKKLMMILLLTLPGTIALAAQEQPTQDHLLRYQVSGQIKVSMTQEIFVTAREEAIAGRDFSFTFDTTSSDVPDTLAVTLSEIRASYTAHGMNQRLSTSHLVGGQFTLNGDGRSFSLAADGEVKGVGLGAITEGELIPADVLAALLPVLPEQPVDEGITWETSRDARSLEGWAWAEGPLARQYKVTKIETVGDQAIIRVSGTGSANIAKASCCKGFVGEHELTQTLEWSFDADSGRLISINIRQEAEGTSMLPQGEVDTRQITNYELLVTKTVADASKTH